MKNDCDCVIHVGPHFLHMNQIHFRQNTGLLTKGGTMLGMIGFGSEEVYRMDNLVLELRSAGCGENELIYTFLERIGYAKDVIDECRAIENNDKQERVAVWESLGIQ